MYSQLQLLDPPMSFHRHLFVTNKCTLHATDFLKYFFFCLFLTSACKARYRFTNAVRLSACLSIQCRYTVSKRMNITSNFFGQSGRVPGSRFLIHTAVANFQVEPLQRGVIYTRVAKCFKYCSLSRKQYDTFP